MEYKKDFLIVGNKNIITYKNIFPYVKNNQFWFGVNEIDYFTDDNGNKIKFGNTCWITNLNIKKTRNVILKEMYFNDKGEVKEKSLDKYKKYINYEAINVDRIQDIPIDYFDVIGVPITFFNRYNPCLRNETIINEKNHLKGNLSSFFDIVGFRKGIDGKDLKYLDSKQELKTPYFRVLIKRKDVKN